MKGLKFLIDYWWFDREPEEEEEKILVRTSLTTTQRTLTTLEALAKFVIGAEGRAGKILFLSVNLLKWVLRHQVNGRIVVALDHRALEILDSYAPKESYEIVSDVFIPEKREQLAELLAIRADSSSKASP